MKDRNIVILNKIIKYANEISDTISRFNLDFSKFEKDHVMKNAISMCLLQIGELAGKLTDEFRAEYNQMPWRDIVSIRNRAAHNYGNMDTKILWDVAIKDIPALKEYCENVIISASD
ncbi:HepT-like ribonuclease domain-containing protein [Candidatus Bathycorpusculum sp.]|uniref:HepT-like ribonuclease domain-containing protein n=1 Tax=Candidatus Bathycorpusculum sp. TaxID=2994959 RepID=UPI002833CFD7|nr:DUF86 domain-containing protein [Candidatus Termitimicrobium sp.]MCL2432314.1 DUF86 domain-containing protein [Candidatus Termitimicrobium sp.]